jgi:hypothetical protein
MKKRILNFWQFVNEDFVDTPENNISTALRDLKEKLEKMFNYYKVDRGEIVKVGSKEKKEKEESKISFSEMNLELNDLDMSDNSLTLQFSDEEYMYSFCFTIDIKDAVPKDPKKDFDFEDIENCQVIYKKYSLENNFELKEGPMEKKCKLKDIDEEFLIKFGIKSKGNQEEFKIETK